MDGLGGGEGTVKEGLEKMLGLALCLDLARAHPLELHDGGELLLLFEGDLGDKDLLTHSLASVLKWKVEFGSLREKRRPFTPVMWVQIPPEFHR